MAMSETKRSNLRVLVETAAAHAAYHKEYKATPLTKDWNKMVQAIGKSGKYLRVPYAYGLELKPVWTAAYREAQKGHVPGKSITIPKPKASPKPKIAKAPAAPTEPVQAKGPTDPKAAVLAAIATLAIAVEAL